MTTSTKTLSIISLFSLACMSGWASAAAVNQSLTGNNKFENSQHVQTSNNEVKSENDRSNQFQTDGSSQADVADDTPIAMTEDTDEKEAPQSEVEPQESTDEMTEMANITSDLSSAMDGNVSLVTQTLSQAEVSNTVNSTINQGLDTVTAADATAQVTQASEQLVTLAVQNTVSATTQALVLQSVNGEVSEQISSAVQAETATEMTQTIAANIGF
ncbi:MAG: hypothetical protein ACI8R9_001496 [Paraglaciecola sp.]|jgi:hypothetical protein